MRVVTSFPSRFAIFEQARELYRHGALQRLIHGYPRSYARARGLPDSHTQSVLSVRAYGQLLWLSRSLIHPSSSERRLASYHRLWARSVAARLRRDADIFIGLSSFSLEALSRARELGQLTVIEHGSLHERFARRVLAEETTLRGGRSTASWPPDWVIEREDAEFRAADYVFVQSRAAAQSLVAEGVPESKIRVNPLGVDTDQFHPTQRDDGEIFRVIYCGTVSVSKGVPYLLRAFRELNLPRSELWLVGSVADDVRPDLESWADDARVRLMGAYPQSALAEIYGQCSVAVLPSLADGFGMVVPQAMACGLPVIVTENVGAADLVVQGENGFVIPIRDVARLKSHLLYLFEHADERAAMGQCALATVSDGHSWSDYGDRLLALLDSALVTLG